MVVRIAGRRMYLWRALDHEGEILDILVQRRRDIRAALRLMRDAGGVVRVTCLRSICCCRSVTTGVRGERLSWLLRCAAANNRSEAIMLRGCKALLQHANVILADQSKRVCANDDTCIPCLLPRRCHGLL